MASACVQARKLALLAPCYVRRVVASTTSRMAPSSATYATLRPHAAAHKSMAPLSTPAHMATSYWCAGAARQVPQMRWQSTAAEAKADEGRGWMPTDSVLSEDPEAVGAEWTPTGTGGYPADWAEHNETEWTPGTLRAGVVAVKLGMTQTWDPWGLTVPLTVLQVQDNQVVEVRTKEKNNVEALVVGGNNHGRPWKLRPSTVNMFASKKLPIKRDLVQFKITDNAKLEMGAELNADHFVPGQYVDTISKTIGKGTAGVMKRHGMKGGNASHGTTKTYRKMGATGGGQDPGRVWPGKKMAGRMGNRRQITLSLQVYKIDTRWNVIYVKGAVSGAPGTVVTISDARRKKPTQALPCPTAKPGVVTEGIHIAPPTDYDPGEWPLVSTP